MLLAIDISNTNIKFGLYHSETMQHHWVVSTARQRTTDEYAMVLSDLMRHAGHHLSSSDARLSGSRAALLRQRGIRHQSHTGPRHQPAG
jgi:pantothenate kinase type III